MERGRWTVPNAAKDRPFWPPPRKPMSGQHPWLERCPSPCTGLLWRINIKSSPWYPYCIIRRRLRPTEGRQATKTVIWRNSISLVPHLRDTGSSSGTTAGVMLDFRQFGRGSGILFADPRKLSISLASQIQSTVRFILSWENEKRRLSRAISKCSLFRRVEWSCNFFGQNCIYGSFVALFPLVPFPL